MGRLGMPSVTNRLKSTKLWRAYQDLRPMRRVRCSTSKAEAETRPISEIISDARAGLLPGVKPLESGFGFRVVDEAAALAGMAMKHG